MTGGARAGAVLPGARKPRAEHARRVQHLARAAAAGGARRARVGVQHPQSGRLRQHEPHRRAARPSGAPARLPARCAPASASRGAARGAGARVRAGWRTTLAERWDGLAVGLKIAMVGKYTGLSDAYLSVLKALQHACLAINRKLDVQWIEAGDLEDPGKARPGLGRPARRPPARACARRAAGGRRARRARSPRRTRRPGRA